MPAHKLSQLPNEKYTYQIIMLKGQATHESEPLSLEVACVAVCRNILSQGFMLHPTRNEHRVVGGVQVNSNTNELQDVLVSKVSPCDDFSKEILSLSISLIAARNRGFNTLRDLAFRRSFFTATGRPSKQPR
jgi:hypothetical protein